MSAADQPPRSFRLRFNLTGLNIILIFALLAGLASVLPYQPDRQTLTVNAVAESLDRVAGRIRFPNRFDDAIEDLLRNQDMIRDVFFEFYPQLQEHVAELALETPSPVKTD